MNLYKLTSTNVYDKEMFIIAKDKPTALVKYYELEDVWEHHHVNVYFICEREDIIPTVEPIKEFES